MDSHSGEFNAFLGAGTEYLGRLDFVGTVRIDGIFHGEIVSEGALVLGREAIIQGQISVGTLFSDGKIVGDVEVKSKAVLQKNSTLEGSLKTPALVVEEGAAIEGSLEMSNASVLAATGAKVEAVGFEPDAEDEPYLSESSANTDKVAV
ncbi:MAG: polymer-forming cytoskeletal protein [Proteobacteria bacterium]|nr:polymer-forming cytoskeletal protein [Pseudomonadota bacterium]MBU1611164.1 polymer-forming cytoskeletal protein [Pseudomonadota bacterium]